MDLFDLESLAPGTRGTYTLPVMTLPDGSPLSLTVLAAIGAHPGPTLTVLAGVHGDEYEGIRAIPQVFNTVDVSELHGRLIMVPICNPPAYHAVSRNNPIDGLNLARVFPGDPKGTVSQRLAHVITEKLIKPCSFLIDLHSSGMVGMMPTMVGYNYGDSPEAKASQAAAMAFGADVAWGHPLDPTATGRTISAALDLGIPWLYTEATGARRTRPEDVACYYNGVLNVMRHLGMLKEELNVQPPTYHLFGTGNTDMSVAVNSSGYFVAEVALLDYVTEGQVIGRVLDLVGNTIEELRAHKSGRIGLIRTLPPIHAGEGVVIIADDFKG